jgi:hypothetical protein
LPDNTHPGGSIYLSIDADPRRFVVELIVVVVLLLLLFGSFPAFPYSRNWGYYPSGGLGTILVIVVILWALGVI